MTDIAGYIYDTDLPASPVSLEQLELLKTTVLWSNDDTTALRAAGTVLGDHVEDILDVWYGFVGSNSHLVASFNGADGQPSGDYLEAVRLRFGQWIRDLCMRDWDSAWLAYQHEIAQRHINTMGDTDHVDSDQTHIAQRYLIAFIVPLTITIRDFLTRSGHDTDDVDAMHAAWFKAVTLTAVLWSQPYNPGTW